MRLIINGKSYRLKENIKMRLQGVALLLMGGICHKVGADGACILMLIFALVMLFGECDE